MFNERFVYPLAAILSFLPNNYYFHYDSTNLTEIWYGVWKKTYIAKNL